MYHADLSETKEQEQKGRDDLSKREVYEQKTEELILFCWNRTYPAQLFMTLDLSGWKQVEELEFEGNSHKKITLKKYVPYIKSSKNKTGILNIFPNMIYGMNF